MFFDFDALEEADSHLAEAPSPVIADGPEATRPVEDTAPYPSQGMFKEMSDQHYRKVQELKKQEQLEDDPHTWIVKMGGNPIATGERARADADEERKPRWKVTSSQPEQISL